MPKIINEITPLAPNDCFYLVDRYKQAFDYPMHRHAEMELNLVCNCKGCQRIVGDSVEVLDSYDLVIVGQDLEHGWYQNGISQPAGMREITVQWEPATIHPEVLSKNPFASIKEMLDKARRGIAFGQKTIKEILPLFDELVQPQSAFFRYLKLLEILYLLSVSNDYRTLSTTSYAKTDMTDNSRRIRKVKDHIAVNYAATLKLDELASMVGMTPTAFSRFFKTQTNQTLSDYIINLRLGHAIRNLVDTSMTCAEICYTCGFNNLSNFNRLFKKKKGCTPMEFREKYVKTKIII